MRVLIKQGRACNNDCTFCHASDRTLGVDPFHRVAQKIAAARDAGAHTLVLSGGEPTVRADLLRVADLIRQAGLRLGLVTNARRLADSALVDALIARGLDYAYVSLHGSRPDVHDPLVGAPAFHETMAGIRNLHGRVASLSVNTVVTRSNLRDLRNVIGLLDSFPALTQKFTMPQPKGAAWDGFDDVVPTLQEASVAVADALRHGMRRHARTRFGFEGFPLCLLPGFEDLLSDLRTHDFVLMSEPEDDGLVPVDDVLLTKPPRCHRCLLRARCPGIYIGYADRRGDAELKPVLDTPVHELRPAPDDVPEQQRAMAAAAAREGAAQEQRAWVRLTYACNNRCVFCLDRGSGRSEQRPADVVRQEILDGRSRGAERLILSGGEATTHPAFLDFVAFGKQSGYRWVQAVSNGRMFAYPKFVARAITAGLDEVTFSMHGHNAELHDQLVGVSGAFDQAYRGIHNALRSRRIVVNIDVVINALNVAHLRAMLDTFVGWGVKEFDLLHLIPFGGAWEPHNRHLFYDPGKHIDALRAALELSKRPGIHLWLNRFPPAHAEGFEALIQDPHKLHDEVRGRADEFRSYLAGGPPLMCREPHRCERCYLHDACDALDRCFGASKQDAVELVRVRADAHELPPFPASSTLEVHAATAQDVIALLPRARTRRLRLRLLDVASLTGLLDERGTLAGLPVEALIVGSPEALHQALSLPGRFDIVVELDRHTAPAVVACGAHADRLVVTQPARELLSEALERDIDLAAWFASVPFAVRTESIAPCLSGVIPSAHVEALDAGALDAQGRVDAQRFVGVYVRDGFTTKSLRCASCALGHACRGMHINWVRAHGYASLRPEACADIKHAGPRGTAQP